MLNVEFTSMYLTDSNKTYLNIGKLDFKRDHVTKIHNYSFSYYYDYCC